MPSTTSDTPTSPGRRGESADAGLSAGADPANGFGWLTPAGMGAIAVIRFVGPGVAAFCRDHLRPQPRPGRPSHVRLVDRDDLIDDPLALLAADGSSLDLCVHGGRWIMDATDELAVRAGFVHLPDRPPISPRLTDAVSPLEREVEQWLPMAGSERAIRTLLDQPRRWESLQPVPDASAEDRNRLVATLTAMRMNPGLRRLLNPPTVAIAGIPNAGKSTLANALAGFDRSIVADAPGTTRDWVGGPALVGGSTVILIDTPGRRDSTDPIEADAIRISRTPIETADLVVLVLDAAGPAEGQVALLDEYPAAIRVWNKSDLPAAWPMPSDAWPIVARSGTGVGGLADVIAARLGIDPASVAGPMVWTDRQAEIVARGAMDPSQWQHEGFGIGGLRQNVADTDFSSRSSG